MQILKLAVHALAHTAVAAHGRRHLATSPDAPHMAAQQRHLAPGACGPAARPPPPTLALPRPHTAPSGAPRPRAPQPAAMAAGASGGPAGDFVKVVLSEDEMPTRW